MMPPRATKKLPWAVNNETLGLVLNFIIALVVVVLPIYLASKASNETAVVAKKVETVSDKVETATVAANEKLEEMAEVGEATHKLTNSAMGIQLELNLTLAQQIYEMTDDPKLKELAEKAVIRARAALDDHIRKQANVDEGKGSGTE